MANLFFKSPITVPSIFHIPDKSMIMNYFSMLFIALSNNCLIFAMPYRQCRRAARVSTANHLRSRKLKRQLPDKAFYYNRLHIADMQNTLMKEREKQYKQIKEK